jgi:hypothetical protein
MAAELPGVLPELFGDDRLPTELFVAAHLRRCSAEGVPVYVARRGEAERGTLLVKLSRIGEGCVVYSQARNSAGRLAWLAAGTGATVREAEADEYIARAVKRDPDLWVIEIEVRGSPSPDKTA